MMGGENIHVEKVNPTVILFWPVHTMSVFDTLQYVLDSIFIRFGSKLYRQIEGITLINYSVSLDADLFRFVMGET